MAKKIVADNLNLNPGSSIRVVGDISPNPSRFAIEMGADENNLAMHFNPRFQYQTDRNVIVFNSKLNGHFASEIRNGHFPFQVGSRTEVFIEFEGSSFVVKLPDGYRLTFPNRTEITKINYVTVFGDIVTKAFAFE